jgi:hypothetical protein
MVLSRREKYIVVVAAAATVILSLDYFALSPLLEGRSLASSQKEKLQSQLTRAEETLVLGQKLSSRWQEMIRSGIKADPAEAESQVLHAIRDRAEESKVNLSLLKPDRLTEKTQLPEIAFEASGNGTMESVARLIWQVENAGIPLRISKLQLAARKEGADDLSFQLRLSTVYLPAQARGPAQATTAASSATGGSQ